MDGVYSDDPKTNPSAKLLDNLSYDQVLAGKLRVMDLTAITLCMERKIPLVIFNLRTSGNVVKVVRGENVGTRISI